MLSLSLRSIYLQGRQCGHCLGLVPFMQMRSNSVQSSATRTKFDSRGQLLDNFLGKITGDTNTKRRQLPDRTRLQTHQSSNQTRRHGNKNRSQPSKSSSSKSPVKSPQSAKQVLYTRTYIEQNFECPEAADYGVKFDAKAYANILKDAHLVMQKTNSKLAKSKLLSKCVLKVELDYGIMVTGHGHGKTGFEAENNAVLHVACLLHEQGLLKDILPGGRYFLSSSKIMTEQKNAIMDVINYAARYDCSPTFEVDARRSALKGTFRTTYASIEKLKLHGLGRGTSDRESLLRAAISLKSAAEKHHVEQGGGLLLVQDYTRLGTHNAKQFVDFSCFRSRLSSSMQVAQQKSSWLGTVKVHDRQFSGFEMHVKRDAEDTAYLVAALALKLEDESVWHSFVKEMKRGDGQVLQSVRPIDLSLPGDVIHIMRQSGRENEDLLDHGRESLPLDFDIVPAQAQRDLSTNSVSPARVSARSKSLQEALSYFQKDESMATIRAKREELPMLKYRQRLLDLVTNNDVCVVVGATGSGKTTQLPQLILDEMIDAGQGGSCNIICTQPRRIAAMSVAQRVAAERNESLRDTIGYSVRFDNKSAPLGGSINFCTTGILLRQLQDSQDRALKGITHLIVDEVHERDVQIDFLLVTLRQIIADRKVRGLSPIKVILMSATIDTDLFCTYFGDGFPTGRCPHIEVPGRTFPVETHFLDELYPLLKSQYSKEARALLTAKDTETFVARELTNPPDFLSGPSKAVQATHDDDGNAMIDWNSKGVTNDDGELDLTPDAISALTPVELMSLTIAHLLKSTSEGSILVFLPGLSEITALNRILIEQKPLGLDFQESDTYKVYLLHSAIPQMQQEVFERLPEGKRKIILSTNIAETSITIPDVVYVVDSGKHREAQYDATTRVSSLASIWISKSNAKQRAGRAGRVQNGHYYTMISRARSESLQVAPLPGILKTDLQELCLQIKSMRVPSITKFLGDAIEPPSPKMIETAVDNLQQLGALDAHENLTPLGRLLSILPLSPALGRMVLLGLIFKCLDPILILAASASHKEIFVSPLSDRDEAQKCKAGWAKNSGSDHVAVINAFTDWRKIKATVPRLEREFLYENFLHRGTLRSIAQTCEQILDIMQKAGLIGHQSGKRGEMTIYGSAEDNTNSNSLPLQSALTAGGLYPNIAIQTSHPRLLRTASENAAIIHPNSLAAPRSNKGRYGPVARDSIQPQGTLFAFSEKTKNDQGQVALRGTARASPLSLILFGGEKTKQGNILTVDDWIPFFIRFGQTETVEKFSRTLDAVLQKAFSTLKNGTDGARLGLGKSRSSILDDDANARRVIDSAVTVIEQSHPDFSAQGSGQFQFQTPLFANTHKDENEKNKAILRNNMYIRSNQFTRTKSTPTSARRNTDSTDTDDLLDMLERIHRHP